MWIFDITLKNGKTLRTAQNDGDDATDLSEKLQSWMGVKGKIQANKLQESVSIKDIKGNYIIFKVDELCAVSIEKIDDDKYKLMYGLARKTVLNG